VTIQLSPAQVDKVVRAARSSGNVAALLSGLPQGRGALEHLISRLDEKRFSRSLLLGLLMLALFPSDGTYIRNSELAKALDTSPSTSHRYLATLLEVGLVERHSRTRLYRLAQA
jgi:DNA-binding MarR family transcriptional regulator